MFIPKYEEIKDVDEIKKFISTYPFGNLISVNNNLPEATPLPFVLEEEEGELVLYSHLALINKQSETLDGQTVLVTFQEPNAYISPKNYLKGQKVPTWNYISVQFYGELIADTEFEDKVKCLERMISSYETAYFKEWNKLDQNYKRALIDEILTFKIKVTQVNARKKMSQDKSEMERERIINDLSNSNKLSDKHFSELMKKS